MSAGAGPDDNGTGLGTGARAGAGAERVGIRQVAELAGVAISSVSRAVSGHPGVSETMRSRVLAAADQLGWQPDLVAGALRRGSSGTVGFVVGDISNPLLSHIALGAEVTARAAGYSLVLTNSMNDAHLDAEHIRLLQRRRVDGLLLSLADEQGREAHELLASSTVPVVLIDRELPSDVAASAVLSDHRAGVLAAAEHLVELGHRRIALIAGYPHVRPTRERVHAVEAAVEARRNCRSYVRVGAFTEDHGYAATRELMLLPRPPTAIISGGNQLLIGVLRFLGEAGLRVPADVSLVTCDSLPWTDFLAPPLASVQRDAYRMGEAAAELLLNRLNGHPPEQVLLPTQFIPSPSCDEVKTR